MALAVRRHRADRAVFQMDVELLGFGPGAQFLELAAALGGLEIVGRRLLQPVLERELVGALAAQKDVGAVLHHRPGER